MNDDSSFSPDTASSSSSLSSTAAAAASTPQIELAHGLSASVVGSRLEKGRDGEDLCRRYLAFYLNEMHVRCLAPVLGFVSTRHFVEARLHMDPRRASELIRVGAALEKLKSLDDAFLHREISWSAVELVTRVATVTDEAEWVEAAKGMSCRELKDRVQRALDGKRPRREERAGMCGRMVEIRARVSAVTAEKLDRAMAKLRVELGGRQDVTEAELIGHLLDMHLSMDPDGSVPGWKRADRSIYQVVVHAGGGEPGVGMQVETPDGVVGLSPGAAATLSCDAAGDKEIPRATRRQVLQRDGQRCRCCARRFDVHVHHLVFRENGGSNSASNLLVLCRACHTLVHDGLLLLSGSDQASAKFADKHGRPLAGGRRERTVDPVLAILGTPDAGRPALPEGRPGEPIVVDPRWFAENVHMFDRNMRLKREYGG